MEQKYKDTEPMNPVQNPLPSDTTKDKGVYSNLKRQLTEDDLNSPGTQRLILAELDKYDECKKELDYYKDLYHRKDKENAVYKQQVTSNKAFDIVYSSLLAIGPALLGLSTYMFSQKDTLGGWSLIVVGSICLISGLLTKIFVKPSKYNSEDEH